MAQRAARRQFVGTDGRMVLEFHARYATPYDDTTVMAVFHRTTDGGVSVLLERDQIRPLADWFTSPYQRMEIDGLQTTALLYQFSDGRPGCRVVIAWNGSGRARSVELSGEDARAVAAWLDHIDRCGWAGWKSGEKGSDHEQA